MILDDRIFYADILVIGVNDLSQFVESLIFQTFVY